MWRNFGNYWENVRQFWETLGDFAKIYALSCGEKLSKSGLEKKYADFQTLADLMLTQTFYLH